MKLYSQHYRPFLKIKLYPLRSSKHNTNCHEAFEIGNSNLPVTLNEWNKLEFDVDFLKEMH